MGNLIIQGGNAGAQRGNQMMPCTDLMQRESLKGGYDAMACIFLSGNSIDSSRMSWGRNQKCRRLTRSNIHREEYYAPCYHYARTSSEVSTNASTSHLKKSDWDWDNECLPQRVYRGPRKKHRYPLISDNDDWEGENKVSFLPHERFFLCVSGGFLFPL